LNARRSLNQSFAAPDLKDNKADKDETALAVLALVAGVAR